MSVRERDWKAKILGADKWLGISERMTKRIGINVRKRVEVSQNVWKEKREKGGIFKVSELICKLAIRNELIVNQIIRETLNPI